MLHGNDAGTWTKASALLYPHQWSWDSAFIAMGWAHLDVRRAMTELEGLFAAQWSTGMVPHLVFRAGSDHPYFPGPEWWDTPSAPAAAGLPVQTTGICQSAVAEGGCGLFRELAACSARVSCWSWISISTSRGRSAR